VGKAAGWLGATKTGVIETEPAVASFAEAVKMIRAPEASGPRYTKSIHKKNNAPIEVTRESSRGGGVSINVDTDVMGPSK
jgi:hypothetical protein